MHTIIFYISFCNTSEYYYYNLRLDRRTEFPTGVALQLRTADRRHNIGSTASSRAYRTVGVFFVYVHDSCTKLYNVKINRALYDVSYIIYV